MAKNSVPCSCEGSHVSLSKEHDETKMQMLTIASAAIPTPKFLFSTCDCTFDSNVGARHLSLMLGGSAYV